MTPFSVILDGTVGPVACGRHQVACAVGARILLLDPVSLETRADFELPPQARLLRLAAAGDHLFALLDDGVVVRRTIADGKHWYPVAGETALDLVGVDNRVFVLVRARVVELDVCPPGRAVLDWSVPKSAERLAAAGRYLVAFGPGTLRVIQIDAGGGNWTVESMQHPIAAAGRDDTLLVADHLAGLYRLRVGTRVAVEGPIPSLLHPRAVAFDDDGWLAAEEGGLAASGGTPEVGTDTVLDLRTTNGGVLVIQSRRVSLVRDGRVTAVAEFPGYAFQSESCGDVIASATQGGLFLCSRNGVTRLPLPEDPVAVAFATPWLLATSTRGLHAIDLSHLDRPALKCSLPRSGEPVTLAADPIRLRAVWGCGRTVSTLDLRGSSGPTVIDTQSLGTYPRALALADSRIYAATGPGGLLAGDTGNSLDPVSGTGYAMDVAADGERALVAAVKALVVCAHHESVPHLTDRVDICACDLARGRVFVAAGDELVSCSLSASQFEVVGSGRLPFVPRRVRAYGDAALVSGAGGVVIARAPSVRRGS